MPRFMIYPNPHPDGTDADTRVEIGWVRDGGSVTLAATKLRDGCGRHDELTAPDVDGHVYRAWEGQWVVLDRAQINNLIRNLRRARDQAYGADQ